MQFCNSALKRWGDIDLSPSLGSVARTGPFTWSARTGIFARAESGIIVDALQDEERIRKWPIHFASDLRERILAGAAVLTARNEVFGLLSSPADFPSDTSGAGPNAYVLSLNDVLRHSPILERRFYAGAVEHHVEEVPAPRGPNLIVVGPPDAANLPPDQTLAGASYGITVVAEGEARGVPPLRYPHAAFYRVGPAGDDEEIPYTLRLSPPPAESRLEFRFGFDVRVKGIPQQGPPPGLIPPPELPDVVLLRVEVWSEDVEFERTTDDVTVPRTGQSGVASFPMRLVPPVGADTRVTLFAFVRYETHLIAAFRVEASVAATPGPAAVPQGLQYIYLDHLWFRFERQALTAPALTIYLRAEGERIQVFAFTRDRPTWGSVGALIQEFQEKTRQIYVHITKLAGRLQKGQALPFGSEGAGLAELGYQLFSDLFYSRRGQPEVSALAEYVQQLPAGAEVTIATEARGRSFLLPWGLVYDGPLPTAAWGGQQKNGFWGHRFKLTVCPSLWSAAVAASGTVAQERPRMATIYENHDEAKRMTEFVTGLAGHGKVDGPSELPIHDFYVPRLATDPFELLHCFCHGYTELHDYALSEALASLAVPGSGLMVAGNNTRGSYLQTQRGMATLARLQAKVSQLRCRPVVLLSMCESAQVSSSGRSFVTFFLEIGAGAVVGTEGPNPWELAYRMDTAILSRMLEGSGTTLRDAVWEARRNETPGNVLALIYTVYGDGQATLVAPPSPARGEMQE